MTAVRLLYSGGQPFIASPVQINDQISEASWLMIDTGSGATIFNSELMEAIGIELEESDVIREMRGIGGIETVLERNVGLLRIGPFSVDSFTIQRGPLDYGFQLDGIVGLDFLRAIGAVIDFSRDELRQGESA